MLLAACVIIQNKVTFVSLSFFLFMLSATGFVAQNSSAAGFSLPCSEKSTKSQVEHSPGYSSLSIPSALDSSREHSRPFADESKFTTNTARSLALKSAQSSASMVRTLMSLSSDSPPGWGSASRTFPAAVGVVHRLATAHGDKHQAAQFKTVTDRAQTEGPRTLAQVELHLSVMRQRASDISKNYAKLTSLSCLLTLQRQYNIALQNLESENKMILSLVDKVIQGGSTQKVLSAIKQLKPIMQMMQLPLIDRMPFARFNESCTDQVKEAIHGICVSLSKTSKQEVYASSFIPWNTDPSETWVSDKALLLTQVIDQQLDVVGDTILGDVMNLYEVNQKLSRMVRRTFGSNVNTSSFEFAVFATARGKCHPETKNVRGDLKNT